MSTVCVAPATISPVKMMPIKPSRKIKGYLWAMLLARIYDVFPLICGHCGGEVRIIDFATETVPIRDVLEHIG